MPESDSEVPLLERAELPHLSSIPKDAREPLEVLSRDFGVAEVELQRQEALLMRPLYARRDELIRTKLQEADFWPRVFANSPAEVDTHIQPTDAQIIGSCLKNLTVERFAVNEKGEGEPRSLRFVFEFATGEENRWFEDSKIVKEFHWRKQIVNSPGGQRSVWEGLVSEPVRIKWKKDMDPTRGLLDAACDLADAEKALLKKESKQKLTAEERRKLPEFEALVKKTGQFEQDVESEGGTDDDGSESSLSLTSFFAWFGYRGRDVTESESELAAKEESKIWEEVLKRTVDGEEEEEEDNDDDEEGSLDDVEIFPDGESLAFSLADDLWLNALKYYAQSYDIPDDLDADLSDLEDEDEESNGEEEEEDEEEKMRPRKKART
ncbi:hypothetical protein VTO42DRAFT_2221 [Malbranchea cinnamomea]